MEEGFASNLESYSITIPGVYKSGCVLPPDKFGTRSCVSYKSFEYIAKQIQKIHLNYSPFLWIKPDLDDPGTFVVKSFYTSYKIHIYADLESDTYIVGIINTNMPEHVVSSIFESIRSVI